MRLGAALGLHAANVPVLVVLLQWLPGCPGAVFCDGSPWFLPGWIVACASRLLSPWDSLWSLHGAACFVSERWLPRLWHSHEPGGPACVLIYIIHCLCRGFLVTSASCVALQVFDACMLALVFPLWSALPGDLGGPSCAPSIWLAVLLLPTGSVTRLRLGFASAFQKHVYIYMYIHVYMYIYISIDLYVYIDVCLFVCVPCIYL